MDKQRFYKFVDKLILPLFTGSFIDGEEVSSVRDNEVAYGKKNSLLIFVAFSQYKWYYRQ